MRYPPEPVVTLRSRLGGRPRRDGAVNKNGAFPFMRFTVPIGERKRGAVIVENVGVIDEIGHGCDDLHPSIVNRPGIVIDECPNLRRSDNFEIAPFTECGVRGVRRMGVTAV